MSFTINPPTLKKEIYLRKMQSRSRRKKHWDRQDYEEQEMDKTCCLNIDSTNKSLLTFLNAKI